MKLSARIGAIEFDDAEVRLSIVKTGGRLPVVLELHTEPVAYEDATGRLDAYIEAVNNLRARVKNKPSAYVLCASSRYAVVRAITVPFRGKRRVAAAVRFELEPYLAFPIEELVVDFATIREVDGQTQVLAVGMRRGPLEEQLSILQSAGIDPEGIGLDAIGLTALWQAGRKAPAGLHAVLHVRQKGSILAVLNGKTLAFFRYLPVTFAQMHENPGAAARDVQNTLRAFRVSWDAGEDIADLAVTGVNLFEEERQLFEDAFTMPVAYEDLGARAKLTGQARKAAGDEALGSAEPREGNGWEAAVGVAWAAAGAVPYALEFRQGELAPPNAARGLVQHAAFSVAIAAVALAGYAFYLFLDYRANVDEMARIQREMRQILKDTFPDSQAAKDAAPTGDVGGVQTYEQFMNLADEASVSGRRISLDVLKRPSLLDVVAEISRRMPNSKVTIERIRYDTSQMLPAPQVTIEGRAPLDALNQALDDLRQSPLLVVEDQPNIDSEGALAKFTVKALLKEGGNAQADAPTA